MSPEAAAFHAHLRKLKEDHLAADDGSRGAPDMSVFRPYFNALYASFGTRVPSTRKKVEMGGVPCVWATPEGSSGKTVVLFLHGGGYASGNTESHANIATHIAKGMNGRALQVDYRLTPENLLPAPMQDCVAVYHALLDQGYKSSDIIFAGESAGGALCITTQILALQKGLPPPAAAYVMCPWLDLECEGRSYISNRERDLCGSAENTKAFAEMAFGTNKGPDRADPMQSPLHASLAGLAPMLVQTGGDDVLVSDSETLAANAKRDGVDATIEIVPDMQHMFQMLAGAMPEADEAVSRGVEFLKSRIKN